eukprot:141735-Chlamydomonas_euryale.AAC.1
MCVLCAVLWHRLGAGRRPAAAEPADAAAQPEHGEPPAHACATAGGGHCHGRPSMQGEPPAHGCTKAGGGNRHGRPDMRCGAVLQGGSAVD